MTTIAAQAARCLSRRHIECRSYHANGLCMQKAILSSRPQKGTGGDPATYTKILLDYYYFKACSVLCTCSNSKPFDAIPHKSSKMGQPHAAAALTIVMVACVVHGRKHRHVPVYCKITTLISQEVFYKKRAREYSAVGLCEQSYQRDRNLDDSAS